METLFKGSGNCTSRCNNQQLLKIFSFLYLGVYFTVNGAICNVQITVEPKKTLK